MLILCILIGYSSPLSAQIAIGLKAGAVVPRGEFHKTAGTGFTPGFQVMKFFSGYSSSPKDITFGLGISVDYHIYAMKKFEDLEYKSTIVPILGNINFYSVPFVLSFGAGIYRITTKDNNFVEWFYVRDINSLTVTANKPGVCFGGGLTFLFVEIIGRYHVIFTENDITETMTLSLIARPIKW